MSFLLGAQDNRSGRRRGGAQRLPKCASTRGRRGR